MYNSYSLEQKVPKKIIMQLASAIINMNKLSSNSHVVQEGIMEVLKQIFSFVDV